MKDIIKKNYKKIMGIILTFLVFLLWNIFLTPINADEIWNYGFAHNIYTGLIPYSDFNMVITPLFPFLMSLIFHIFGSNLLVMNIEQAIIFTIIIYLAYERLEENIWIFLLFLLKA